LDVAPWPAAVRKEIQRRRAALAPASGAVLDLDSAEADVLLRTDPVRDRHRDPVGADGADAAAADAPAGSQFDRIVSFGLLTTYADLAAVVASICELLRVDGELLLIEPVGRPGWRGTMVASAASTSPLVRGRHVSRDVPAVIRSSGLLVSDLERFTVGPSAWPLKHFVQARAIKLATPLERTVVPVDHDGSPTDRGAA